MEELLKKYKFKNDTYTKRRGAPALLKMECSQCRSLVIYYQKDGPGPLKRCYLDRIVLPKELASLQDKPFDKNSCCQLRCSQCNELIGVPFLYEKESRPAFHLMVGSFALENVR